MNPIATASTEWLEIDAPSTARTIGCSVENAVFSILKRRGVVVGLSGGIDSSVVAALCVRALGKDRVFGLFMPERECSDDSARFGERLADRLGIATVTENITPILEAAGCYRRRDDAIRSLMPEYGEGYKCKLVMADIASGARYSFPSLVVQSPDGETTKLHLDANTYRELVAASNFKQRARKMIEYYHADRLQYAVAGTPNRLEFDQGFFVKNGDGAADVKPIAHLYKTQVRQLAEYLDIPAEIRQRPSTTDTFPLTQSQEEFYFAVPLEAFDLCLYGHNHRFPAALVAAKANLSTRQVEAVFESIESKRRATRYLHEEPLFVEQIPEVA
jgi:NAD+ synthase